MAQGRSSFQGAYVGRLVNRLLALCILMSENMEVAFVNESHGAVESISYVGTLKP